VYSLNNLQGDSAADCKPAPDVVPRRASRRRLTSSGVNSLIASFMSRRYTTYDSIPT